MSTNTTAESAAALPAIRSTRATAATRASDFTSTSRGIKEFFLGNSPKPRLSIGVGVNWISPFGPLRIDIAKALMKQDGDETKFFTFNVGTQF